jgi:opacity protein-like surface antigen
MFAKSLIAAAALAAVTAGMASTAEAKVKFHGDFNINLGGGFPVYDTGYYDDHYGGGDCFYKKVKKVKWHDHGGFVHKHIKWKKQLICY